MEYDVPWGGPPSDVDSVNAVVREEHRENSVSLRDEINKRCAWSRRHVLDEHRARGVRIDGF